MSIFLMQPSFLPWIGFFDMVDCADKVILLDDVEFSKGSWENRNKIKTKKGLEWLTIPILKNSNKKLIKDLLIFEKGNTLKKLESTIHQNYNNSNFFNLYRDDFFQILTKKFKEGNLCNLNKEIILWIIKILNIKKKIYLSSELNISGNKIDRIISFCEYFRINKYISTAGTEDYLKDETSKFRDKNIKILLHDYDHPTYKQLFGKFIPYASCLDLIFNEGHNSYNILIQGRKSFRNLE